MTEEVREKKKLNKNLLVAIIGVAAAAITVLVLVLVLGRGNGELNENWFKSDGSKLVLTIESDPAMVAENEQTPINSHLVYTYSGETVTGLKVYYQYENPVKAQAAYEILHDSNNGQYKDVLIDGRYVILVAVDSEYEHLKASDVKQQIDFMEMMKGTTSVDPSDGSEQAPVEAVEAPAAAE